MDITEEVDVMRVCNVVDDECTRYELFIVGMVAMIVRFLAVVAFVAVISSRIAVFSTVSVGIVLGMLSMCIVLISMAVVLSQERCSREEKQGGKQGLE